MALTNTSLTNTSFAILGLLDIREWSAYELAQQTTRSLAFVWPVSESQIYAEPKRLAGAGLITITLAPAGPERQRQIYSITLEGRAALRRWLASEPTAPRLQAEILLRCLFAPSGDKDDLLRALHATKAAAVASIAAGLGLVDQYLDGENPFPERTHANILWMHLVRDLLVLVADWSDDAIAEVERWDDSRRGGDRDVIEAALRDFATPLRARGLAPVADDRNPPTDAS